MLPSALVCNSSCARNVEVRSGSADGGGGDGDIGTGDALGTHEDGDGGHDDTDVAGVDGVNDSDGVVDGVGELLRSEVLAFDVLRSWLAPNRETPAEYRGSLGDVMIGGAR